MEMKLLFGDAAGVQTPLLAVFAVDVATGKGDDALPALLTTSDAITEAAERFLTSGEFKATLGETLVLHGRWAGKGESAECGRGAQGCGRGSAGGEGEGDSRTGGGVPGGQGAER